MVYNWGTRSKEWSMTDGAMVTLVYKYIGIFWLFKLATKRTWYVNGQHVSSDEVKGRYGDDAPALDPWNAYGLILGVAAIALFLIFMVSAG